MDFIEGYLQAKPGFSVVKTEGGDLFEPKWAHSEGGVLIPETTRRSLEKDTPNPVTIGWYCFESGSYSCTSSSKIEEEVPRGPPQEEEG